MTSPGRYRELFDGLPRDLGALAGVGHGLLVHEHIAPAYGLALSDEQRAPVHVRPVEQLLELLLTNDDRPLAVPRPPERRLAGNCRHFTVLMVAMLRHQGVPARARCGFGGYFPTEAYEDHWVCEYWHAPDGRWALVDAQIERCSAESSPGSISTSPTCPATASWSRATPGRSAVWGRPTRRSWPHRAGRVRRLVDRGQPPTRRRGPQQPGNAALGRLGCDARAGRGDPGRVDCSVRPARHPHRVTRCRVRGAPRALPKG